VILEALLENFFGNVTTLFFIYCDVNDSHAAFTNFSQDAISMADELSTHCGSLQSTRVKKINTLRLLSE
jgi:hypothetical protein